MDTKLTITQGRADGGMLLSTGDWDFGGFTGGCVARLAMRGVTGLDLVHFLGFRRVVMASPAASLALQVWPPVLRWTLPVRAGQCELYTSWSDMNGPRKRNLDLSDLCEE